MLTLTFLGTSAGVPGRNRNVSALAVHSPLTERSNRLDSARQAHHIRLSAWGPVLSALPFQQP